MSQIIRPLSIHEASFPVYAQLAPGAGNVVNVVHFEGDFSEEQISSAWQQVVAAQPCLRGGYVWFDATNRAPGYYFVDVEDTPLSIDCVECAVDESLNDSVKQGVEIWLNHVFKEGARLWGATLYRQQGRCALVMGMSHAIGDGHSMNLLAYEWLKALSGGSVNTDHAKSLGKPLWDYMPRSVAGFMGVFRSIPVLMKLLGAEKNIPKGMHFPSTLNVPIAEHRCNATKRCLDGDVSKVLLDLAKEKNESLHGVLGAATMVGLFEGWSETVLNQVPDTFAFPFISSVSMRNKLAEPLQATEAGCLSSGVTGMLSVSADIAKDRSGAIPWSVVSQINQTLKDALEKDEHWKVLRLYKTLGLKGLRKMFVDTSEKPLSTPLSFSNLGRLQQAEGVKVTDYAFYAAFHGSGAAVNISAGVVNNRLFICFTSPNPAVSRIDLNAYADRVVKALSEWADR